MESVLKCGGTAFDPVRMRGAPEQAFLPGFAPTSTLLEERKNRNWVFSKIEQNKVERDHKSDYFKKLWGGSEIISRFFPGSFPDFQTF